MLDTGHRRRDPVERDVADDDLVTGLRAESGQRLLDAEPGQPVGEVADRLVVAEVGLAHPPLRLLAADDETLALTFDREAGIVDRAGPEHDARRLLRRRCAT